MPIFSPLRLGLVISLCWGVTAVAAPRLKDKPALYYPIKVGDTRVYEARGSNGSTFEYTNVVTKVEAKDGVLRVTLGRVDGGETSLWAEVEVSDKGVVRHTAAGLKLDPAEPVIKLPVTPGETWEYQRKVVGGGRVAKKTYTVVREEEVEVPAGKFQAIRIDEEWDDPQGRSRTTHWHAPGVGLVKMVTVRGTADAGTYALKSFTPGK